jgi:hypothetical protein
VKFEMHTIDKPTELSFIKTSADQSHKLFTKAVVDIDKKIMVIGSELHVDEEQLLLDTGSQQESLWGINIWIKGESYEIEFDSMINLRPNQNNYSREVEDTKIQEIIINIVRDLIK